MPSRPRVYVDSCYYIDAAKGADRVKADSPGRETDLPWIQSLLTAAVAGEVEIIASTLVISECLHTGDTKNIPDDAKSLFRSLLTGGQIKLVAPDFFIVERARDLLWIDGINCGGGADGVHVATALDLRCSEFLTANDRRGPGKADAVEKLARHGLCVCRAALTRSLPDKYRQGRFFDPHNGEKAAEHPQD